MTYLCEVSHRLFFDIHAEIPNSPGLKHIVDVLIIRIETTQFDRLK